MHRTPELPDHTGTEVSTLWKQVKTPRNVGFLTSTEERVYALRAYIRSVY